VYGIRELSRGRQKIGSKLVFFDQDKVYIGDDVYPLPKGLLELLFKKIPDEKLIEDQDLGHYKDILLKSNAHRVQNRSSGRLQTSNVPKFPHPLPPPLLYVGMYISGAVNKCPSVYHPSYPGICAYPHPYIPFLIRAIIQ